LTRIDLGASDLRALRYFGLRAEADGTEASTRHLTNESAAADVITELAVVVSALDFRGATTHVPNRQVTKSP
jgi:hypothetical protein